MTEPTSPRSGQTSTAGPSSAPAAATPEQQIPMLTDVLHLPRYSGAELPESLDEVSWPELSQRVQENVMERLMRRSETMLADQLSETLKAVVDRHIQSLGVDLHDTLERLIRDLVARAVGDELTRVHTEITHRKSGGAPVPAP